MKKILSVLATFLAFAAHAEDYLVGGKTITMNPPPGMCALSNKTPYERALQAQFAEVMRTSTNGLLRSVQMVYPCNLMPAILRGDQSVRPPKHMHVTVTTRPLTRSQQPSQFIDEMVDRGMGVRGRNSALTVFDTPMSHPLDRNHIVYQVQSAAIVNGVTVVVGASSTRGTAEAIFLSQSYINRILTDNKK